MHLCFMMMNLSLVLLFEMLFNFQGQVRLNVNSSVDHTGIKIELLGEVGLLE